MKKVYIAGKISGLPYEEVVKKFAAAQTELEAKGFKVINPIEQLIQYNEAIRKSGGTALTEEQNRTEILKLDIDLLYSCNAIYLLKDWPLSTGATLELFTAKVFGKEILFECTDTVNAEITVREVRKNERFSTENG